MSERLVCHQGESDEECGTCVAPFIQVFESQPWKVLWWIDHHLHRLHKPNWVQQQLCNLVDRRLWLRET